MPTKIQIDGVGTVEVDDNFMSLPPDQQQRTVEEIAANARKSAPSAAPGGAPGPLAPKAPPAQRNPQQTYQALGQFVTSRYPNAKITSGLRTPEHNREVGGAENSYHLTGDAIDVTGLNEGERNRLYTDLVNQGMKPNEFMFHRVKGGSLHLHLAVDSLPEGFGQDQHPQQPSGDPNEIVVSAPTEARKAEIAKAHAEAAKLLAAGKEQEAIALLAQHRLVIPDGQLEEFRQGKRRAGFTHVEKADAPSEEYDTHGGLKHDLNYYGDQIRRGAGDILDAPANIADLLRSTGNWIQGEGFQSDLGLPDWARPGEKLNEKIDQQELEQLGYVPKPKNGLQRYAGAATRLATGAAVPASKVGAARGLIAGLVGGATGGVTGEAAHDVAPYVGADPETARTVGQIAGAVAGGVPLAAKPIADARFVAKRLEDPRSPFAAKAVEKMAALAEASKPNGVFPKGRGPLSVEQINAIGKEYLNEVQARLGKMDLPDVEKARLDAAIKRRADLTPDEIAALEGTEAGDAVAEGIRFFQATRSLTPGYNGYKPGPIRRLAETGIGTALTAKMGPAGVLVNNYIVRPMMRGDPADLNMSRLDAGAKALKRKDAWAKIGAQTGSDQVGSKTQQFIQSFEQKAELDAKAEELQARATLRQKQAKAAEKQQAQADKAQAKADKEDLKASRFGMSDKEFANYSARSASAEEALKADPVPAPQPRSTKSALNRYNKKLQASENKLSQFDQDLEAPAPKPKRSGYDLAAENNIAQGIQGNHNSYADTLGVQRSDVLQALRNIKTDDIDPFEIQKLIHGYKLSPAGRAALIPRLQKQLKDTGVAEFRAKQAAGEKVEAPKAVKSAEPAAEPNTTNADTIEPTPQQDPNSSGNYRDIRRPQQWREGKANYQGAFDKGRERLSHADSPHSQEIVAAAQDGLDHIRNGEKTTEAAMRYFDDHLGPKLRSQGFLPEEISDLRKDVEEMATVGKRYRTDAQFEKEAKVGGRGRPRKPQQHEPSDDVPF